MIPTDNQTHLEWTPDWDVQNQNVTDVFQPSQKDFFQGMDPFTQPLIDRVVDPKSLAETLYWNMEFSSNPTQLFQSEWDKIEDSAIKREVLRHLTSFRGFFLHFIERNEALPIKDKKELEILYIGIQQQFGIQSQEAIDFYLFASKQNPENDIYLEALFLCSLSTFLKEAEKLPMTNQTALSFAERLAKKDLLASQAFLKDRELDVVFFEGKILLRDTKENMDLFLKALPSLRMEDKREFFLSKSSAQLEMLFGDLPYTQRNGKAIHCFVVSIMARWVRGKRDPSWENHAREQAKTFRDNVYTTSCVRYIEKVQEWKRTFRDEDVSYMLNKVFFEKEDVKKRLPLLHTLTTLKVPELLSLPHDLPLLALENILEARSQELFGTSKEEAKTLMERFSTWRAPFAILRFCIAIDSLPEEIRVAARDALKNFLLNYLSGNYETWRYRESPHLRAMREQSIFDESLEAWWRQTFTPQMVGEHHTVELTSDPTDFVLTGEECGGCQRLDGEPRYILPILGLMDGAFKMLVIRDQKTGKMTSRAFVRWLTDKESGRAVLLIEPPYTFNFNPAHIEAMLDYLVNLVKQSGREIPIVISPASTTFYGVESRVSTFPSPLYAEGLMAPKVFSDTYGMSQDINNEDATKTNGVYILKNACEIII